MQGVAHESDERGDVGSLIRVLLSSLAYFTLESFYQGEDYNGGLERELLNELDGVRSRLIERDLTYG